jgi:hypothetical protein
MITKFTTVYAGHVDLPDRGQNATPANERRYSNEHLATVFDKTDPIVKKMDAFAPLGFVPELTPAHVAAVAHLGGWAAAGVPMVEHYMDLGSWFAGTLGSSSI